MRKGWISLALIGSHKVITKQYKLRSLFALTLVVAIATVAIQFLAARVPTFFVMALLLTMTLSLVGCSAIVVAMLVAFSIAISSDDGNRAYNLTRCGQLAIIGLASNVPLLLWILVLPYLI